MNFSFKVRNLYFKAAFDIVKGREQWAQGYGNRTQDGYYITMLDYDGFLLEWVQDELRRLAHEYRLNHFFIFKSSDRHFHAVNVEKLKLRRFESILNDSSADAQFKRIPREVSLKSWILRYSEKGEKKGPTFQSFETYHDGLVGRTSGAHLTFFEKCGLIPKRLITAPLYMDIMDQSDGIDTIHLCNYKTMFKVIL